MVLNSDGALAEENALKVIISQTFEMLGMRIIRTTEENDCCWGMSIYWRKNERLRKINHQLKVRYVIHGFHGNT